METMTKNTVNYIYNTMELKNEMIKTIESIEKWADSKNYRIKGNITEFKFEILRIDNFGDISKRQKKNINKYIFYLKNGMTLKKVNSFFSLIHRMLSNTNSIQPIRVLISEKEEKIQMARKKMKEAKESYETLLKVYKEEKGNFYKTI